MRTHEGGPQHPVPNFHWAGHVALVLTAAVATIIIGRYGGRATTHLVNVGASALVLVVVSVALVPMIRSRRSGYRSGYVMAGYGSFAIAVLCMLIARLSASDSVSIGFTVAGAVVGLFALGSFLLEVRRLRPK